MKTSFIINSHLKDAEFHYKGASLMNRIALSSYAEQCFPKTGQVLEKGLYSSPYDVNSFCPNIFTISVILGTAQ